MDESRRLHLAAHLLPAIQRQLPGHASATTDLDPVAYVQALSAHRQAASWSENPLLFSLAAVVYLRRGTLSGSRSLLYREVIDAVLETRQPDASRRALLRARLAEVALQLYQIKGRTFHIDDLRACLNILNNEQHATWSPESALSDILNSGVLDVVAADTYSFRHQTFQEYLAASALASRFMSEDEAVRAASQAFAWNKHTYSRWHEIQRLLAGILVQEHGAAGVERARAWLERLLRQQNTPEGDPGNLSLELALKLLGEVAELEHWQSTETRALEEEAATIWSREVLRLPAEHRQSTRSRSMAAEVGSFSATAQRAALEPLVQAYLWGNQQALATVIGSMRSSTTTHYLLEILARTPYLNQQREIKRLFGALGAFAPLDLLLAELRSEIYDRSNLAQRALEQLAPFVPAEQVVPILLLKGFGRPVAARGILSAIAKTRELPLQNLLPLLDGSDKEVAFLAALVLAAVRHPAAIPFLLARLPHEDEKQRRTILMALEHYKAALPLAHILPLLEEKDQGARLTAVKMLAHHRSDESLNALIHIARDPHNPARATALQELGKWHVPASLNVIIEVANDPAFKEVEEIEIVIDALAAFGTEAPLELLLNWLKEWRYTYKVLSAFTQKSLREHVPLQPLLDLYAQNWSLRGEILETLSKMGHKVDASLLIEAFNDEYLSGEEQVAGLFGHRSFLPRLAELIETAAEQCWTPYSRAIVLLECLPERCPIALLARALTDERWQVSDAAAKALCQRADEVAEADLLPLLKHKHARVRYNALQVLAEQTERPPLAVLINALHDHSEDVRMVAAKALARYPEDAPLDDLLAATLDSYFQVRIAAAATLGKLGQRDPVLATKGVLNMYRSFSATDEEVAILKETFAALGPVLPGEILLQAIREPNVVVHAAAQGLARMQERAPIDGLVLMLQDQSQALRRSAALALGQLGRHAPTAPLIAALRAKNAPETRQMIIEALVKLSEHGNIPDTIFLQNILRKNEYSTYISVLKAFNAQRKRLPEKIVRETLEFVSSREISVVIHHLALFPELIPALPPALVVKALAIYAAEQRQASARYRHFSEEPDQAGYIPCLLPALPLNSLLEMLAYQHSQVRCGVLLLLAALPGQRDLEPFLKALRDPDDGVRRQALRCLGQDVDNLPVQAVVACLHDPGIWVCEAAIEVLASLGTRAPLSELAALLDSPEPEVRNAVIQALRQPGLVERTPLDLFLNALEDSATEERPAILRTIYARDPQQALEACLVALGDSDEEMAVTALHILQQISPASIPAITREAIQILEGGRAGRFLRALSMKCIAYASTHAGRAMPEVIARLGGLLDWPSWEVRVDAVQALGTLRRNIPDATIRKLLELRHDPRSRTMRETADQALAEILSLETGIEDE